MFLSGRLSVESPNIFHRRQTTAFRRRAVPSACAMLFHFANAAFAAAGLAKSSPKAARKRSLPTAKMTMKRAGEDQRPNEFSPHQQDGNIGVGKNIARHAAKCGIPKRAMLERADQQAVTAKL
jgi:hypothetical protein